MPTIVAGAAMIAAHWGISALAFGHDSFARAAKGKAERLAKDGEIDWKQMKRQRLGQHDLEEALRQNSIRSPEEVDAMYLERDGSVTTLPRTDSQQPRVLDIEVADGVQTIRIQIES